MPVAMRAGLLFLLAMAWPLPATPQEEVFIFEADEAMQVHAATAESSNS